MNPILKKLTIAAAIAAMASMTSRADDTLPYQNPQLSADERAADLCSRLTTDEKVKLMMNSSPAIERLGIPAFDWWSEALHGVGRNGLATVFPSCIGMAASFNDSLIYDVFTAVSDEARAKNTIARRNGRVGKYRCLSFWTPTVNIFRDPRWGRGQETYGEDPYMNGRMGSVVIKALQGPSDSRYRKLLACAKHFAVHSGPEKTRHSLNIENLPARDLWESYLPAFKDLIDADAREVMCAYQRFEGDPCCGSDRLLQQILRDEWGFDGLVVTDCGAITDFHGKNKHGVSPDAAAASAKAVRSGSDVECGQNYRALPVALERGEITIDEIDRSVRRLLKARFELGDFDPDSLVSWTQIPESVINCKAHQNLALEMARQQTVLLTNKGILPLDRKDGHRIMVMGPNAADSTMQWGIYYGQPGHTVTILDGIREKIGDVDYTPACGITSMTESVSIFDRIGQPDGTKGLAASYWNNTSLDGAPDVKTVYTAPIHLDNGGNTAFAPGVNLENFSTRMHGRFTAEKTEELTIKFANDDGMRIIVNGDTIHNRWKVDQMNLRTLALNVEQGKTYDIEINYMQLTDDATLNFDITREREVTPAEIVKRADGHDIIIFVGGISPALEREQARVTNPGFDNGDRTSIELPQAQRDIIDALVKGGKKVVLVNCSGSAVALAPEAALCDAIVEAWYPGEQGGTAIADILFGDCNPSGKLPVTFYTSDAQVPTDFEDYRMAGRTYRYLREKPLFEFGHGLSYTTFEYGKPSYKDGRVTVKVKNTGRRAGTEIVQLYLRRPADTEGPSKTLRGYEHVTLDPGESRTVTIDMPRERFETWDEAAGRMRVIGGDYQLMVGSSSADKNLKTINVKI